MYERFVTCAHASVFINTYSIIHFIYDYIDWHSDDHNMCWWWNLLLNDNQGGYHIT